MGHDAMEDLEQRQPCLHCGATGEPKYGRRCEACLADYLSDLQRLIAYLPGPTARRLACLAACRTLDVDSDELEGLLATVSTEPATVWDTFDPQDNELTLRTW